MQPDQLRTRNCFANAQRGCAACCFAGTNRTRLVCHARPGPTCAGGQPRVQIATASLMTMSRPYEEILDGATLPRSAPGERHEKICARLHREMAAGVNGLASTQLLAPRTRVQVSRITALCSDLALVTAATGTLF